MRIIPIAHYNYSETDYKLATCKSKSPWMPFVFMQAEQWVKYLLSI